MNNENQTHFSFCKKENEGIVDIYILAPGISVSFNQIYTDSWMKGDSSRYSDEMLILNFCLAGRCDVSLAGNRYTIVKENRSVSVLFSRPKIFIIREDFMKGFRSMLTESASEQQRSRIYCRKWEFIQNILQKCFAERTGFICIG